uniref:Anti-silencing protein, ASF1-like family protein n=1 Tax=Babesia bovis TaxID=5865 RepID=S6B266_BABBO|nr:anti-silencing protein, ASF1-like family protein [Babesia bovis]
MSLVNVTNITVGNNVCPVTAPLVFQIEFECLEDLKHDVEWKIIYVTSDGHGYLDSQESNDTQNSEGEIVLDAVCLGPIYKGILEFEFRVAPPDFNKLDPNGILGMQAVLVTASYCDQEFIRIGYYTNNCYDDPKLRECPPDTPIIEKMVRCIIDQPRVTRFPIKWDSDELLDPEGNDISRVINDHDEASSEDESDYDHSLDKPDSSNAAQMDNTGSNSCTVNISEGNTQDKTTSRKRPLDDDLELSMESRKVHRATGLFTISTTTSIVS